jgi:hypothetical protein
MSGADRVAAAASNTSPQAVKKRSKAPDVVSVHFWLGVSPTLRKVWTVPRGT